MVEMQAEHAVKLAEEGERQQQQQVLLRETNDAMHKLQGHLTERDINLTKVTTALKLLLQQED